MDTRRINPIPGFPHYFAGDDGTIWTQKRKGGNDRGAGRIGALRQLKTFFSPSGYYTVNLDLDGKVYSRRVHRLVLEAFVGPAPEGYVGCHYPDPDKTNNHINNLRWDTHAENMRDKYRDRPALPVKVCKRCGKELPISGFYKDKRAVDGLKTECKSCHSATSMATRDADKKRAANREFMRRTREQQPDRWR